MRSAVKFSPSHTFSSLLRNDTMAGEADEFHGNGSNPPEQPRINGSNESEEHQEEEISNEEYNALDRQIDEINSCLDALEQRNDQIHSQLKELLESSRSARQEFQATRDENAATPENPK